MTNEFDRQDDMPRTPELTTADLAAAAERTSEAHREEHVHRDAERLDDRPVERAVAREVGTERAPAGAHAKESAPSLLADNIVEGFRTRWSDVQASFVDEPRRAVEQADALVADAIKHLAESFARERSTMEGQWDRGDNVSTEDLRQALRRYRAFFTRLLSV